ncbi:MAG: glycosyltransferase family 2 protein [Planctomycetota bacterium]
MTPEAVPLSACVITYQEEDRIGDCLRSLSFCDDILVVDSASTDRTREVAAELGARVMVNAPFPGHREQKQFAADHARHDWVLSLDADERVMPALRDRILKLQAEGFPATAYAVVRHNYYLGKFIRHGLFCPDLKIRLFDRRRAHWGGTNPHDRVELQNDAKAVRLDEVLEHHTYRTLKEHLQQIESFTRLDAIAKHKEGRRSTILHLLVRPPAMVIKGLILKGGFLDGWRGFVISGLAGYYSWLKCWRLRQLNKRSPEEK